MPQRNGNKKEGSSSKRGAAWHRGSASQVRAGKEAAVAEALEDRLHSLPLHPPSVPFLAIPLRKKTEKTKITKETRTVFLSRGLQKKRSPGREQGRHRRTGSVADTRERCAARITRRRREQRYIKYSASGLRGSERGARWLAAAGHW